MKRFEGTQESLLDYSYRPKKITLVKKEIVDKILNLQRRDPDASFIEIWVRIKDDGIDVSSSLTLRTFKRNNE